MGKRFFHYLTAIILSVTLSGCASSCFVKTPVLKYKAVTAVQEPNNISIEVINFTDNRENKEELGIQTELFIFKRAAVRTKTDISGWITDSLKAELKNAGYAIVDKGSKIRLSGMIEKVSSDSSVHYTSEITIRLVLVKNGDTVLNNVYTGRGKDLCWTETDRGFANILQKALQDVLTQIVADINGALLK